ncbi:MAG: universal stress protein [Ideonella sp.]
MTPFRSIVAATDFSIDGNNAVARAAMLARLHDARLTVLHVVDNAAVRSVREWFMPPLDTATRVSQAQVTLHRLIREVPGLRDNLTVLDVQTDDAVTALLRVAERADLLVLGQRPGNRLKDLLLGHTAHRVVERSRTPVLVVKQAADAAYQRVLVPFDFTPASDSAAVAAAALALDVDLQIFHASGLRKDIELRQARAPEHIIRETLEWEDEGFVARMRRKITKLGLDSRAMQFSVERGLADSIILEQGRLRDVDLMVVGRHRRSRAAELLLGSVCNNLLKGSRCDMLIVPHHQIDQLPAAVRSGEAGLDSPRLARSTAAFARTSNGNWMPGSPSSRSVNREARLASK